MNEKLDCLNRRYPKDDIATPISKAELKEFVRLLEQEKHKRQLKLF